MAERWVGISEAAALEAAAGRPVNKSSVSRFIAGNPDIPVQRMPNGSVKFIEYGAFVAARTTSLSVQDKLSLRDPGPNPVRDPVAQLPTDSTARKRAADAEKAELDLAERKGDLLSRAAAIQAVEAAGAAFVQALERRRRTLAQRLAGLDDPRAVEHELKAADRSLLEALVTDLNAAREHSAGD